MVRRKILTFVQRFNYYKIFDLFCQVSNTDLAQ
jgi:hypothetical protein